MTYTEPPSSNCCLLCADPYHEFRLDVEEVDALTEALRDVPGEVWLFGSRAEPSRRGGDIDLLVLTDQPAFETSRLISTRFFSRCEEKLDVVVFDPAHLLPELREWSIDLIVKWS